MRAANFTVPTCFAIAESEWAPAQHRVRKNHGSVVHASLDSVVLAEAASAQTCVLDRHAEKRVFVLLVVGGKGILVEQHQFRVVRARFCEVGKLSSDGRDQVRLSLHPFIVGHSAMRIADSGCI